MDPIGAGGEEPREPIKLLPEKVWSKIFQLLMEEDPQDILSLSHTCVGFRSILQNDEHLLACGLAAAIPLVLKWLSKRNVLNCREICKIVGKMVDKVLDNADLIDRNRSLNLFPRLMPPQWRPQPAPTFEWIHFYEMRYIKNLTISSENLEALIWDVDEKAVRTVVKKSLDIKFKWTPEDHCEQYMMPPDFLERTLTLLNTDLISQQLVQLQLRCKSMMKCNDPIWLYEIIRRCVGALPNLKSLPCSGLISGGSGEDSDTKLDQYIVQGHPLPPAAHLEYLNLSFRPLTLELCREVFLRYGSQSELQSLVHSDPQWSWEPILTKMHAEQLTELIWEYFSQWSERCRVSPVTMLVRMVQQFPSVSFLTVDIEQRFARDHGNHSGARALEELRDEKHYNVKYLTLAGYWYNIPLAFFAGLFPNLESLSIHGGDGGNLDPDLEMLTRGRMVESGLWRLLPKLKTIWYCRRRCTRAEVVDSQKPCRCAICRDKFRL